MVDQEKSPSNARNLAEEGLASYRSVSPWAVGSLVLGLASPLAVIGPVLWILPGLGIVVGIVALRHLATDADHLVGSKAAVGGLALSLLFFTAALSDAATHRWWIESESRTLARQWFELICQKKPSLAHGMTLQRSSPIPLPRDGFPGATEAEEPKDPLREFVQEPLVRFLLAHGKESQIRYWSTEAVVAADKKFDGIVLIYAITWQRVNQKQAERKVSFFARLTLRRELGKKMEEKSWSITHFEGGVNPFEDEN